MKEPPMYQVRIYRTDTTEDLEVLYTPDLDAAMKLQRALRRVFTNHPHIKIERNVIV